MRIKISLTFLKKQQPDAVCPLPFIKIIVIFKSYNPWPTHYSVEMRLLFITVFFNLIYANYRLSVFVFKGLQRVIPKDQIIWWNILLSHLFSCMG